MAKNLRAKIGKSDTLIVYDVSSDAVQKLQKEADGEVEAAKSVREVAEKAVSAACSQNPAALLRLFHDDTLFVLSMI